jgi:glycosyltransferase involved in cell wall biosynthesis
MKIAQVAPLFESVPPKAYGGTERVVSYLTEALAAQGHDVTLFASGDSATTARLIPVWPKALRLSGIGHNGIAPHMLLLEEVAARADCFDVMHFHVSELHLPLARRLDTAHVTTLHGRLDLPGLAPLYREFLDIPLVSISHAQRTPIAWAGWAGTVYHGLPHELLRFDPRPGQYLAFLGRISPEKRLDRAIAVAKAVGMPLRVAAKVDDADRDYFEREIRHLLDDPAIEYIGEISERQKGEFLGGAAALLFPIDWPEPFGLVMIEALACGTPVVAFRCGSVPEVIEHGVTGFVVSTIDEAIAATRAVGSLDRRRCRSAFERRFSASRMVSDYVRIYETLRAERRTARRRMSGAA